MVEISPIRANSGRENDSNHSMVSGGGHEVNKGQRVLASAGHGVRCQWKNRAGFQKPPKGVGQGITHLSELVESRHEI